MAVVVTVTDKVAELRSKAPQMPAIEVARQVGVSRERVRQILVNLGLPTRFRLPPRRCSICGTQIERDSLTGLCRACRHESCRVTLVCDECGRQYKVRRSYATARQKRGCRHKFCGLRCMGKWAGRHYGWGVQWVDWDKLRSLRELGVRHFHELGYTHGKLHENWECQKRGLAKYSRS